MPIALRAISFLIFTLVLSILLPHSAQALNCGIQYEVISKLRAPTIGAFNVWDVTHGHMRFDETLFDARRADSGNTFAVGVKTRPGSKLHTFYVIKVDKRGRYREEREYAVKDLIDITKMLKIDGGFVVVGNRSARSKAGSIWIGFLDEEGILISENGIRLEGSNLIVRDIVKSTDSSAEYVVAVTAEHRHEDVHDLYAVLFHLDGDGNVIKDRSYYPGFSNEIMSLETLSSGDYIAVGYIDNGQGGKAGLAMRLTPEGGIGWQKVYTRGTSARYQSVKRHGNQYFAVTGSAIPYGSELEAGWLLVANIDDGEEVWQRFYRDDFDLEGQDLLVHDDGRISVMFNSAPPPDPKNPPYVRLLTVSPRGAIMHADAYFNGLASHAKTMRFSPNNERVMTGHTDILHLIKPDDPEGTGILSRDAWMVVAPPLDPYRDPCARR